MAVGYRRHSSNHAGHPFAPYKYTYLLTYLLTFLLTYLLACLLTGLLAYLVNS